MRCPRCGNENPGTNRFCGMCGATLLPAPVPVTQSASTTASRTAPGSPAPAAPVPANLDPGTTASRAAVRPPQQEPTISGPSFLGLNQPPTTDGERRGNLSIDPHSAPSSRNLDYLLEDEEQHRGGAGKFFLILVALLLAGGLGYLRWRHQPFPWQISGTHKPAASQPADESDSTSASPQNSPNASTPASPDSGTTPSQATPSTAPAGSSPGTPATGTSPSITPIPDTTAPPSPPTADAKQPAPTKPAAQDADSDSSADDSSEDVPAAKPTKPKTAPADAAPKPTPAARPTSTVAEAQKYLYGKGVKQDCGRGLRLLKPAADRADSKAMIEMGALYSAGLCTPRDLPTAYRWFAMALHKEPDNQSVQNDLQKLWGEMTQPERQLAIKLSQ